eukprot:SAG31_NODE_2975_length_4834_cov_3.139176_2_plen_423_part_00
MATTFDAEHRVAIGYYLTQSTFASLVMSMLDQAMIALDAIGLRVAAIVCDGASEHSKAMKAVCKWSLRDLNAGDSDFQCAMPHPLYPGRENAVFFISDPPHLMKKAASNLFSSGTHPKQHTRLMRIGEQYIVWSMLVEAFEQDKEQGKLLLPKLTQQHIDRTGFTRLKVKFSTQVLSESMAKGLEHYVQGPAARLVEYVRVWDRYFDVMNSGIWRQKYIRTNEQGHRDAGTALMTQPIRALDDPRLETLLQTAQHFEQWDRSNREQGARDEDTKDATSRRFITRQLFYDLRMAVYGFVGLVRTHLRRFKDTAAFIPKMFSQDPVEAHFSRIRHGGAAGHNSAPAALHIATLQAGAKVDKMQVVDTGNVSGGEPPALLRVQEAPLQNRMQSKKIAEELSARGRNMLEGRNLHTKATILAHLSL